MAAYVLGNGVSRRGIDVNLLLQYGQVYGCNALYRTHTPTVLVATDAMIAREIQESGYALRNKFYTRRPLPNLGGEIVPREYFGFSSGPIAAALAAQARNNPIYLLGFDLGPTNDGKFNNLYAGTDFYKPEHSPPTFTGNWIKQIQRVILDHAHQTFVRVVGDTTADIEQLGQISNLQHQPIQEFLASINKKKGL